jgi:CoA:oxalate CoA-transferase
MKLLDDIIVLDFSQFLSGPSASLRLADFGAEVIKIEKPETGDICRDLYVSDVNIEGESTIFHAINRNKKSYTANLKDIIDVQKIKQLIAKADVMIHNFRPGVMERLGLDYATVQQINPEIIYAEISGFGEVGPWKDLPGQDLLLQAATGLTWLSNDNTTAPTPMGVAVVDILAGTHITQGILAALFQKGITGKGALVQVSMFESAIDFQFEVLTCYFNDGNELPKRSNVNNAHAYVSAPYGIYKTKDGFLALAMTNIVDLGKLINCNDLLIYNDIKIWFSKRDEIKSILVKHLATATTKHWLEILEPADVWCAPVLDYDALVKEEGYKILEMEMIVTSSNGIQVKTTRCPIKVNGKVLTNNLGAPLLGEHNSFINEKFQIY